MTPITIADHNLARWLARLPLSERIALERAEEAAARAFEPDYRKKHPKPKPTCKAPGCERTADACGLCPAHRRQASRGKPLTPPRLRASTGPVR